MIRRFNLHIIYYIILYLNIGKLRSSRKLIFDVVNNSSVSYTWFFKAQKYCKGKSYWFANELIDHQMRPTLRLEM